VNGIACREISFTEQADPPLIHSTPGASTSGTFCIVPPHRLMPTTMDEIYDLRQAETTRSSRTAAAIIRLPPPKRLAAASPRQKRSAFSVTAARAVYVIGR
jgi:hypothetical protein